jgi:hypothetical protein
MRLSCLIISALTLATPVCLAQRHSGSPPTAPARPAPTVAVPIVPISTGMGNIQVIQVNYGVPAPQSLTRQLRIDDEHTRASALSAIGVPGQYLQRGRTAMPRSITLEFVALGPDDELDALLTVELDQHIVTAILVPDDSNWRRIATVLIPATPDDPYNTPSTFLRTERSLTERDRYRAIFHVIAPDFHDNYVENEAQLRIVNKHAVVLTSFVSASRDCTSPALPGKPAPPSTGCNIVRRWLQNDSTDPYKRFTLVSGTGRMSTKDVATPLNDQSDFEASHLRSFSCQPFIFNDPTQHFDPTGPSVPCPAK